MIYLEHISCLVRDSGRVERDTSLLVEGNRIAAIGGAAPDAPDLTRVDCRNRAVIPGFVNAHTHLWQQLLRGRRDDLPLDRWCDRVLMGRLQALKAIDSSERPMADHLSYLWMQAGVCELLRCGTTSVVDMDLESVPLALGAACAQTGIRAGLGIEMVDAWYDKDAHARARTRETVLSFAREFHRPEGRLRVFLAPSEPSMCTPELLRWTADTARELGLGVQMHVNESRQDVRNLAALTDRCAMEYLDGFGLLTPRFSAVHCVHMTPRDIALAARRGVSVVYNPKSNMKLGSGVAPIPAFLRAGINVALATDGPASNDTLDMTEELRAGALLQKGAAENPENLSAHQVFHMATAGGAALQGIDAGVLDEGKLADLAVVDLTAGNLLFDGEDLVTLLVYCLRGENVESVMVDGRFLMEGRRIPGIDEAAVLQELRSGMKRLG